MNTTHGITKAQLFPKVAERKACQSKFCCKPWRLAKLIFPQMIFPIERREDAEKQSGNRKGADNADALRRDKHEGYPNKNPEQPGLMNSKELYQSMTTESISDIKTPALCPQNDTREQMDWLLR